MNFVSVVASLLLLAALAGCVQEQATPHENVPMDSDGEFHPLTLASTRQCPRYAGSPPDMCQADVTREAEPEPQWWTCVWDEELGPMSYAIITDGDGAFAVSWKVLESTDPQAPARFYLTFGDDDHQESVLVRGGPEGTIRIPGVFADEGWFIPNYIEFSAHGDLPFMRDANLTIRAHWYQEPPYQGFPYYVWVLTDGTTEYYFSTMIGLTFQGHERLLPADIGFFNGTDFNLTLHSWTLSNWYPPPPDTKYPYAYEVHRIAGIPVDGCTVPIHPP